MTTTGSGSGARAVGTIDAATIDTGTVGARPSPCTPEELALRVGSELGASPWREVRQADIDAFAAVTGDDQFIHVEPVRAAKTPFGGTVAHGFLTLSLLSLFRRDAVPDIAGLRMGINYGLERVRFVAPVRSGARVRGRFELLAMERRAERELLLRHRVTVEIEGGERPALVAEWLTLAILA